MTPEFASSQFGAAAEQYRSAGLCVLPAHRAEKRPAINGRWEPYKTRLPTVAEVSAWFANEPDALCLVCGPVSGGLEMIDFDCAGELFEPWKAKVESAAPGLLNRLVIESTPSSGWHVAYQAEGETCGNLKLAQRKQPIAPEQVERDEQGRETVVLHGKKYVVRTDTDGTKHVLLTLIETRGEGGLFLCAPTPGYAITQSDLCALPTLTEAERDVLLTAAWELNEYMPPPAPEFGRPRGPTTETRSGAAIGNRPGDDYNKRGDLRKVLERHGWVCTGANGSDGNEYWRRPGKTSGTSATLKACTAGKVFYVFSSNAAPFEHDRSYSPFAVYALLEHAGDFESAARALRLDGYGVDRSESDPGVDISGIVGAGKTPDDGDDVGDADEGDGGDDDTPRDDDPGPVPDALLHVPGFIGETVDFSVTGAPYPSLGMAFCGALAMQAHLCGRRVREPGDLRTNIYVLALGSSSAGKNYPREVNAHLSIVANLTETLRRKFSSGEGIEDRLEAHPCTMYQTDEIDGLLQSVNKSKDARHESILSILLELFSAANMMYAMRTKAGKQSAGIIHQPHLTVFGTATPGHYYEAMSQRMLTNGFFARLIIVDTGKRSLGQDVVPMDLMPQRLIDTASWWANFQPGEHRSNLIGFYPKPVIVPYTDQAKRAADEFRAAADQFYAQAEERSDEVAMTVWGRANENARKLALLYACSENHADPKITPQAIAWATAFVEHQTRRMLFMARQYVASDDFDGICKRAVRVLRQWHAKKGRDALMPLWQLRRKLSLHPTAFKDVTFELAERRIAVCETRPGKTKPSHGFRLL